MSVSYPTFVATDVPLHTDTARSINVTVQVRLMEVVLSQSRHFLL